MENESNISPENPAVEYTAVDFNNDFPQMKQDDYDLLLESMKEHGFFQDEPIVLWTDPKSPETGLQIVDGMHRYLAAKELGIEPVYVVKSGSYDEIKEWCYQKNLSRRHLTQRQKAALLLKKNPRATIKQISKEAQVSEGTARLMRDRMDTHPEDVKKVADGEPLPSRPSLAMPKQPLKFEISHIAAEAAWTPITQHLGFQSPQKLVGNLFDQIGEICEGGAHLESISIQVKTIYGSEIRKLTVK